MYLYLTSCQKRDKVLVIVRGDSFADGIGSSGTTSSAEFYKGTQIQGDSTWAKQLQSLLNRQEHYKFDVDMVGFPGQTSAWFLKSDQLPQLKEKIAEGANQYKYIVYCSEFGTNDEANPGVNDSTSVDSLVNNLKQINQSVARMPGTRGKLFILAYPLTNRADKWAKPNSNAFRNRFNALIKKRPAIISADDVMDFGSFPNLYSDGAPNGLLFNQNDADHLQAVHPNNLGYARLAQMTASAVLNVLPPPAK